MRANSARLSIFVLTAVLVCGTHAVHAADVAIGPTVSAPSLAGPAALTGMLKTDGLLRREFGADLNKLTTETDVSALLHPDLPAQTLGELPPTTDRVYTHTSSQLMRLLIAHPELIPPPGKERKELNNILKPNGVDLSKLDVLVKLAKRARERAEKDPGSELAQRLKSVEAQFDLASASADPMALRARLERFMDGARESFIQEHDASVAAYGEGALHTTIRPGLHKTDGHAAGWTPPAPPAPAADAAAIKSYLEEYLKGPGRVMEFMPDAAAKLGSAGPKWAYFQADEYRPEYAPVLKELGIDVAVVRKPSAKDLETLQEKDGYFRRSEWNRWVQKNVRNEDYLNAHKGSVSGISRSKGLLVENVRVTKSVWDEWHEQLYKPFIAKLGGSVLAPSYENLPEAHRWWAILFRDPETKRLLGGAMDRFWSDRLLWGHYAAYEDELKKKGMNPDERVTFEENNLARWLGSDVFSAGLDHNFKGFVLGRGLYGHKVGMGYELNPATEFQVLKIINTDKFRLGANSEGKNEGVVFHTLTPEVERRYVAALGAGADAAVDSLLGGGYFTPEIIPSAQATVMRHFFTDDVRLPAPGEIPQVRQPLDDLK